MTALRRDLGALLLALPLLGALFLLRLWHGAWASAPAHDAARLVGTAARLSCFAAAVAWVFIWQRRPSFGWRALCRGAFYASIAFVAALCLRDDTPELAVAWAALIAGCSILIAALAVRVGDRKPLRVLDVVLMNLSLSAVVCEAVLRFAAWWIPSPLFAGAEDPGAAAMIDRQTLAPGTMYLGTPINAWGDHDDPPVRRRDGQCLVTCVGDSFSLGSVPLARHYTTVAERALGDCPVYNMGTSSIGPREYLYLVQTRVPLLDPSLIVIALYVGNDVSDVYATAAKVPSPGAPPFFARERIRSFVVVRRLLAWMGESRKLGARRVGTPQGFDAGSGEARLAWLDDYRLETPGESEEAYEQIERGIAQTTLATDAWMYQRFFEYLDRIVSAAGSRKIAFLLIPTEMQVDDPLWQRVQAWLPDVPLERDQPQRRIRAWLERRSVPYFDLLPAFRAVEQEPDGSRHLYHLRDTHFNSRGNRLAGEKLAEFLRTELGR
jgi:hypothetical protein